MVYTFDPTDKTNTPSSADFSAEISESQTGQLGTEKPIYYSFAQYTRVSQGQFLQTIITSLCNDVCST